MNAVIALTGQQMAEQQQTLVQWADARIAAIDQEQADAQSVADALQRARMPHGRALAGVNAAKRRRTFYEKVKAALEAGYQIIPPFHLNLFAIRTDQWARADRSDSRWEKEAGPRVLPQGEGRYVHPVPARSAIDTEKRQRSDGTEYSVTIYENDAEWRDVELPVRALKPRVIEATGKALDLLLFDALGMAPAYRAADPIIAGRILHPGGRHALTFMVAWWLDRADLP